MSQTGSPPVRYPAGSSTSAPGFLLGNLPRSTPMRLQEYFNDFNTYAAGDWTVTTGGTGTTALVDGNGGLLAVTTNNTNNDIQGNELVKKGFLTTSNSQMWFAINFKITALTNSVFMAGFGNTFAALGPTDGIYFSKATASSTLNLLITAGSTSTTVPVGTLVAATYYTVGFYYNGVDRLEVFSTIPYTTQSSPGNTSLAPYTYFNGGNQVVNAAYSGGTYTLANLPTAALTMGFALKATTTTAQVATIDYLYAAEEIVARY